MPEPPPHSPESWAPFSDRIEFEFAQYHFAEVQSSKRQINRALDMWAATEIKHGGTGARWSSAEKLYETIDSIREGEISWTTYKVKYNGPLPPGTPPKWMTQEYDLCVRDVKDLVHELLRTEDFNGKFHYQPYKQFENGERRFSNLMSAEWAWKQADTIAQDPNMFGSTFIPIITGSDKTTVSAMTGNQEFHPGYISLGNITNVARRAHGNSMVPYVFLPIPKVVRCPDGHYRWAIYGLGPYIADYPEQVLLTAIVQNWCPKCFAKTNDLDGDLEGSDPMQKHARTRDMTEFMIRIWDPGVLWDEWGMRADFVPFTFDFPRADIHELLSPDLLHQIIKGTFKDHLVTWINELILKYYGTGRGEEIIDDIDRRLAAVPTFPGINETIKGYVPSDVVLCLQAFLDFCYIARQNSLLTSDILALDKALAQFHHYCQVFVCYGVRKSISLPRQHAMKHYSPGIISFGALNGLCSSITESKHIDSVKETWRRAGNRNPLPQMLTSITRMDQLSALNRKLARRGMLDDTVAAYTAKVLAGHAPAPKHVDLNDEEDEEDDEHDDGIENECGPISGPKVLSSVKLGTMRFTNLAGPGYGYPRQADVLSRKIGQPTFNRCILEFLHDLDNPQSSTSASDIPIQHLPLFAQDIHVYHSALARFHTPSDLCGVGGMYREGQIPTDVSDSDDIQTIHGMVPARVLLFFTFKYYNEVVECAFVQWFAPTANGPDRETGMWMVVPEKLSNGTPSTAVVSLKAVVRGVHLIPDFGDTPIPEDFDYTVSLDVFPSFFVNRYSDHHMYELLKAPQE
ncbi:hypothetical protein BT96DRAFT_1095978 [Gymnopus androsaceus JB14]|uniref:Uncharacterized protein n=1 Tax=Gymnopus androsaceus JB14 TaxID=1447944 RepID=A0A6A4GGU1_9AGAR|nr:hypothetical protein BT96DRAFT_1095978 [Gymnopus androsaceus JB14]